MRTFTIAATLLAALTFVAAAPIELAERASLGAVCNQFTAQCTSTCQTLSPSSSAKSTCGSNGKTLKRALGKMTCKCGSQTITSKVIEAMYSSNTTASSSSSSSATTTAIGAKVTNDLNAEPVSMVLATADSTSTSSAVKSAKTIVVPFKGNTLAGGTNVVPLAESMLVDWPSVSTPTANVVATQTGAAIAVNTQAMAAADINLF